jgi:small subunit ribosomal protein S4
VGKIRTPKHKLSRRFGIDIFGTGGASLARRMGTPPGAQPGGRRRKRTEFADQLEEKQKVKAIYGVMERQFRKYYTEAERRPGTTGDNLLRTLERRLDNVVYRLGYARSRPMARQMVNHGHVQVNGRRVNIPSFLVRTGDRITFTATAQKMPTVIEELESHRPTPRWIERTDDGGLIRDLPAREDVDMPIDEQLIIAFYSR